MKRDEDSPLALFDRNPPTLPTGDPRDEGVDVEVDEDAATPPDDRLEDETTAPTFKAGEFKPASLRRAVEGEDIDEDDEGIFRQKANKYKKTVYLKTSKLLNNEKRINYKKRNNNI